MWQKLMIFTSEGALHDGQPVHRAIVQRLRRSGARGATALRGIWGFAGSHRPHGDHLLQLGRRVPVLTVVIDSPERIAESFTLIDELTGDHGVVSSEMVPALTAVSGTHRPRRPPPGTTLLLRAALRFCAGERGADAETKASRWVGDQLRDNRAARPLPPSEPTDAKPPWSYTDEQDQSRRRVASGRRGRAGGMLPSWAMKGGRIRPRIADPAASCRGYRRQSRVEPHPGCSGAGEERMRVEMDTTSPAMPQALTEPMWREVIAQLRAFVRRRIADPDRAEDLVATSCCGSTRTWARSTIRNSWRTGCRGSPATRSSTSTAAPPEPASSSSTHHRHRPSPQSVRSRTTRRACSTSSPIACARCSPGCPRAASRRRDDRSRRDAAGRRRPPRGRVVVGDEVACAARAPPPGRAARPVLHVDPRRARRAHGLRARAGLRRGLRCS